MPEAFQLKLTLRGISPLIWRRLVVLADTNLADLHQAIQLCMNWTGDFLYAFRLHGKDYSNTDPNANESAHKTRLKDLPIRLRERFLYEYNYYCFWQFDIRIEKALLDDKVASYPKLIAGSGHPPPENIGGPLHYMQWLDEQDSWDNRNAMYTLSETMQPILEALLGDDDEHLKQMVHNFRADHEDYDQAIGQLQGTIWLEEDYIFEPKVINQNLQDAFSKQENQ